MGNAATPPSLRHSSQTWRAPPPLWSAGLKLVDFARDWLTELRGLKCDMLGSSGEENKLLNCSSLSLVGVSKAKCPDNRSLTRGR